MSLNHSELHACTALSSARSYLSSSICFSFACDWRDSVSFTALLKRFHFCRTQLTLTQKQYIYITCIYPLSSISTFILHYHQRLAEQLDFLNSCTPLILWHMVHMQNVTYVLYVYLLGHQNGKSLETKIWESLWWLIIDSYLTTFCFFCCQIENCVPLILVIFLLERNTKCWKVLVHVQGLFLPFDVIGIVSPVVRLAALADLQLSMSNVEWPNLVKKSSY